jgi:hypothetical protein
MNRRPGTPPALTDAEIDDIVAFLGTLTDARYANLVPPAPAASPAAPAARTTGSPAARLAVPAR